MTYIKPNLGNNKSALLLDFEFVLVFKRNLSSAGALLTYALKSYKVLQSESNISLYKMIYFIL